jgi:nicotinamide-nucleotide amidase
MTQPHRIWSLAQQIVDKAGAEGLMLTAAESCTGGMIAAALTDVPGASAVFDRGFVTYSNEAKSELIGVQAQTISRFGAVSQNVAREMAIGALANSNADIAVATTGIAGPSGGSADKPVGTVWFGWCLPAAQPDRAPDPAPLLHSEVRHFAEDGMTTRAQIRAATVQHALRGLAERLVALA